MAFSLEELQRIEKRHNEGKQKVREEMAKPTNAAPKMREIPTLAPSAQKSRANEISKAAMQIQQASTEARNRQMMQDAQSMAQANDRMNVSRRDLSTRPSTKYSNQTAGQVEPQKTTNNDKDFDEYWEYTSEKADFNDYDAATDTAVPHWQNVKKDIMLKNNWTEKQFKEHWKEYQRNRLRQESDKEVEQMTNLAKDHPALAFVAQQGLLPQTGIEGAANVIGGQLGRINPDLLPTSSNDYNFNSTRVREATKQAIRDQIDSNVGRFAFDTGSSLLDMGENMALSGGVPLLMGVNTGAQSASRNQMEALERGTSAQRAADFGAVTGGVSGFMNSVGLDKALGAEAATAIGRIGKAAATEALENVVEDATTLGLDELINKDFSQLETLHDYYVEQGMDDRSAWGQVAKDTGLDLTKSALSGALFGGLLSTVKNIPALSKEYHTAKNDRNYRNQMENLIAENTDEIRPTVEATGNVDEDIDWGRESVPELNKITNENVNNTPVEEETPTSNANMLNDERFNPNYEGVETEYDDDKYQEPEKLVHALTGKPVTPEYASLIRKLESGQVENIADLSKEYNAIPEIIEAKQRAGTGDTSKIDTPERRAKREEILNDINNYGSAEEYYDPVDKKNKVRYTGSVDRGHRADIIIGLPSSGKSSAVVDPISNKYHSKLLDSDEVKKLIPEFDQGWGAGLVHEESKQILDSAKDIAYQNGENIVLPIVGSNVDKVRKQINELKNVYGYEVHLHLNDLDSSKAAARNLRRFASQGRFLDLDATSFDYGDKPRDVYEQLKKEGVADGYNKVSNDVRIGESPVQLEGTEVIPFDWRNNRKGGNRIVGEAESIGNEISDRAGQDTTGNTADNGDNRIENQTEQPNEVASSIPEVESRRSQNTSEIPQVESKKAEPQAETTKPKAKKTKATKANEIQTHNESENQRMSDFMRGKKQDSIEMANGNVIERYSQKFMKLILKEAKENGEVAKDDTITIRYKDGTTVHYGEGDDTSDMKLTNIDSVIYSNENTDAYSGRNVTAFNDADDGQSVNDGRWQLDFTEDNVNNADVETPTTEAPVAETEAPTEAPVPEQASTPEQAPAIDAKQVEKMSRDYLVQRVRFNGQERYRIMKDSPEFSELIAASEFGNKVYKSEEAARKAIRKYVTNKLATEQPTEVTSSEVEGRADTDNAPAEVTNEETSTPRTLPDDITIEDYTAMREELKEAQKGMSIKEMIKSGEKISALDREAQELHPEWFRDGKFIGNQKTYDFSEELELDLQFFAELSEEKKSLQTSLTKKGMRLSQKRAINDQINNIDEQMKGLRKTIVNTAVKAGIVTDEQVRNDPEIKAIAEYVRHRNEDVVAQAKENLSNNGRKIKKDYVSGKTQITTDLDADQAMLLLKGENGELDSYEKNSILKNLATNGTVAGQFIQALAKYADTAQGALVAATDVISNEMEHWGKHNRKAKANNNRIAIALRRMGYDGSIEKAVEPMSREELKKSIVNTIEKEFGSIEGKFDDNDIDFLADMAENKNIPIWQIVDEIEHKLEHGEWYEIEEDAPEPNKPLNGKFLSALNALVDDGVRAEKTEKRFQQLREEVRNTLERESASFNAHQKGNTDIEFTDSDIDYIAHMIEHNASVEDITEALNTKLATGKFGISDETQAKVNQLFEEASQYDVNSQEFVEKQAEAFNLLAEEVAPRATPMEKFDAWRYIAMLGNPKTMLRNLVGNVTFEGVTGAADNLAAIAEGATDRSVRAIQKARGKEVTGIQRTKAVLNPAKDKDLIQAAYDDAFAKRYRQMEGSKYEKMDKDMLRRSRSTFDSKAMKLIEKAVDRGISDTKAVARKYATSMAGYMKANGITKQDIQDSYEYDRLNRSQDLLSREETARLESLRETANKVEKAREYAFKQAEYATFHEDNKIADILNRASRSSVAGRVLVEGFVPFKKTPANIIRSGVEFSPLGAVKSIAQTGKLIYENTGSRKGNLDDTYSVRNPLTHAYKDVNKTLASDVIQSWARTLTGSALASLGYYLFDKGILHSSNDDEKYQDDLEGKQNYSIEINGKTYTVDWAVPTAMPLLLGAEVAKAFEARGISGEKWYSNPDEMFNTLSGLFEPVVETSMLQGVANTLNALTNRADNASGFEKAANAVATAGTNYLTQTIPTLSGQIARTVDNTRRSTDTNTEGLLLPSLEKQGRKTLNKIPFASKLNNPYVNARGEEQKNAPYDNMGARLAYQTLSPWYAQEIDERPSDTIAREAYNAKGENGKPIQDADVFADWKSQVKLNGRKLNTDEMHTYRTEAGQANTEAREALAKSDWFNNASPEIRTEVLQSLNTMADHIGKKAVDPTYASDSDYFTSYDKGGVNSLLETIKADIEKKQTKRKLDNAGLPNNEVTRELINTNDKIGQERYKSALQVAQNNGYDTLTKEEYQIYDKKGGVALSEHLKYKKEAEALGVPNSESFREASKNHTAKAYAAEYKAITSVPAGEDDLGNTKYLEYNDKTAKIYKDKKKIGLTEYATLKKNLPKDSDSDKDYINTLRTMRIPEQDKAYFFVLHKNEIAKSAPKGDENIYMWYQAKDHFNTDGNSSLSKEEKANLYKNVYNYLISLGYSKEQAKAAQKWEFK